MFANWLNPTHPKKFLKNPLQPYQLGANIAIHEKTIPDLTFTKVALLGLENKTSDPIRAALYQLAWNDHGLAIADLGNFIKPDPEFMIQAIDELLRVGIIPILLSPTAEAEMILIKSLRKFQPKVNMTVLTSKLSLADWFDLETDPENPQSSINHLALIGLQSHFLPPDELASYGATQSEALHLGAAQSELSETEPIIRLADLVSLRVDSGRGSELVGQEKPTPNGFFIHELCKMGRYAGMSDQLKAFSLSGYLPSNDHHELTAQGFAQIVWYVLNGIQSRKQDFPVSIDGLTEFIMDHPNLNFNLTFWNSPRSSRWWIQIPQKSKSKSKKGNLLLPCSSRDYQMAGNGELSSRILFLLEKYM